MSNFYDMQFRVQSNASCQIMFLKRKPACFPYGVLFIVGEEETGLQAVFGDLTIPVTTMQAFELMRLAGGPIAGGTSIEEKGRIYRFLG